MKPKYLITNLVYGSTYTKLFTEQHLKSVLDDSNLAAITDKYDVEYVIFTDKQTARDLSYHPNVHKLSQTVKMTSQLFEWPAQQISKYQLRYGLILNMVKESIRKAIDDNALLTTWVADLVVAKEFFPRVLAKMEAGHGAVFVVPLRSASEAVVPVLNKQAGALSDKDLFSVCHECLHPLWVAAHWHNPQFTKLPFTLHWEGQGGMLSRTFQPTPIVFKPKEEMLQFRGMIDGDIPALCDNPYWAHDWTDAPVAGVEPLICYYPPFANRPASVPFVAEYSENLHKTQIPFLKHHMYYPSKAAVTLKPGVIEESDKVVEEILAHHGC